MQFRSVRLWRRGKPQADILGIIRSNTRFPRQLLGDINAQLAGVLRGKEMLGSALCPPRRPHDARRHRQPVEPVGAHLPRRHRRHPGRHLRGRSFLDNDGVKLDEPVPIRAIVRITGDEIEVDLSGVADQFAGPINSGRQGGAETAARIALKYLASPDEPANEGTFRPLRVTIPEGNSSPPRRPRRWLLLHAAAQRHRHHPEGLGPRHAGAPRWRPST